MDDSLLEQVLKFLAPHLRYVSFLILKRNFDDISSLIKRIDEGLETGAIVFDRENLETYINFPALGSEKGKEWTNALRTQIKTVRQTLAMFIEKSK